ncbi:MAG TPA: AraC family transcriptional regulator [Rhizomicrobium sp.]|jgi:AraC-like DNA-binding protein|nr:AraC family transcriptional regulator [Rhizomicrobium sp.]
MLSKGKLEGSRAPAQSGLAGFRFSTEGVPPHFRVSVLNRKLANGILGSRVSELDDRPLESLVVECSLPGLSVHWATTSPLRTTRAGPPAAANGSDCIFFAAVDAPRVSKQLRQEHSLATGEGIFVGSPGDADTIYPHASKQLSLVVPRNALDPWLQDDSTHFVQRVRCNSSAMQLLVSYLDVLKETGIPPVLQQSVVTHVHDLLAVTLGATKDGVELARTRGVRAARLHAIKKDVMRRLDGNLSIGAIAAQHRLTPRQVQRLFEDTGTTFTVFVREQRLLRARAMLTSPRFDHRRIGEIAFEVGFNDLSYFIRAFVRRFGMTPGDARRCG